jgi:hypothetical protein
MATADASMHVTDTDHSDTDSSVDIGEPLELEVGKVIRIDDGNDYKPAMVVDFDPQTGLSRLLVDNSKKPALATGLDVVTAHIHGNDWMYTTNDDEYEWEDARMYEYDVERWRKALRLEYLRHFFVYLQHDMRRDEDEEAFWHDPEDTPTTRLEEIQELYAEHFGNKQPDPTGNEQPGPTGNQQGNAENVQRVRSDAEKKSLNRW